MRVSRFRPLLLGLLAVLAIPVVGFGSTRLLVRDNVSAFAKDPQLKRAAEEIYYLSELVCMGHPVTRMTVPAIRLESVNYNPDRCPGRAAIDLRDYDGKVRAYTWFHIPLRTFETVCGEVSCY